MVNQAYVAVESIIAETVSIPIAGISFLDAEAFFLFFVFFVIILTFHLIITAYLTGAVRRAFQHLIYYL